MVMEFLEKNIIANLKFPVIFPKRFVNDRITSVSNDKVNDKLSAFNDFNHSVLCSPVILQINFKLNSTPNQIIQDNTRTTTQIT